MHAWCHRRPVFVLVPFDAIRLQAAAKLKFDGAPATEMRAPTSHPSNGEFVATAEKTA